MSNSGLRVKLALGLSSAMGLVQAVPALAQTSSADIVVTARRVEERLQDVPISITVYNQEQITQKNIVNSNDLALYTPSLGASNPLGSSTSVFSLRGFNTDQGTAPTVGVFFNDVVAPRGAQSQSSVGDGAGVGSFFDLQNLQVLKGPQGTLFGRNTTGGAILLVPQKPTGNFEGYIEGSIGNHDLKRVQAVLNIPVGESIRARFGMDRQKRDGYVKNNTNIGPRDFNDVNYLALRGSLVIDITPDIENYTVGTYSRDSTDGEFNTMFASTPSALINPLASPFGFLGAKQFERYSALGKSFYSTENILAKPFTKQTVWQGINTTTFRASDDLTIKNIISYGELKYNSRTMVFGTAFDLSDFNPYGQFYQSFVIYPRIQAGVRAGVLAGGGSQADADAAAALTPVPTFRPFPTGTFMALSGIGQHPTGNFSHQSTFTEELQLQGSAFDNRMTWQAGLYYENSKPIGDEIKASLTPSLVICPPEGGFRCANPFFGFGNLGEPAGTKELRSMGIYGQATYDLTDQLKVTGGLRYTWDRTIARGNGKTYPVDWNPYDTEPVRYVDAGAPRCTNPNDSIANNCQVVAVAKSDAPTWLLGLDYKPTNDLLVYAKWVRGYRAGGTALQMPSEYRTYRPEKVDTYEAGLKATIDGGIKGTFNVAAFYNDFSNQQVALSIVPKVPGSVPNAVGVTNAGKSRIYGLEIESALELFEGYVLSGGYSYLNAKIKQIAPTILAPASLYQVLPGNGYEVGDRLQYTPEHKLSVTGAYTLPLNESVGAVTLAVTYTYTSSQITNFGSRDAQKNLNGTSLLTPRNLWDANLSWKGVGGLPIDLSIFGNNIFGEKYYNYILDAKLGFQTGQVGAPRMYGLRARYSFGK